MTSKQVMLIVAVGLLSGCAWWTQPPQTLTSPYKTRRVFAVAPLTNESGSLQVDRFKLADYLAYQLANVANIDVLPVNRTLAAMQANGMSHVAGPDDAQRLIRLLQADALLVGTISAYDPYDPPKLGITLELYFNPRTERQRQALNIRKLTKAAQGDQVQAESLIRSDRPTTVVSALFDAADPQVRLDMKKYVQRQAEAQTPLERLNPFKSPPDPQALILYRISMDLYSQFVSYQLSWRLMQAEADRLMVTSIAQADP